MVCLPFGSLSWSCGLVAPVSMAQIFSGASGADALVWPLPVCDRWASGGGTSLSLRPRSYVVQIQSVTSSWCGGNAEMTETELVSKWYGPNQSLHVRSLGSTPEH